MSENLLTGIRDLDREIVNKMSDRDFLQMCSLNRTYYERVCSDDYFRIRTENRFPETIHYKDYVRSRTRRVRTWKNHYLAVVYYIDLLQRNFEYSYTVKDKSPELLYLARQLFPKCSYNKDRALIGASEYGELDVVKYLVENGADVTFRNNAAVRSASESEHLPVVKYLVEHGADITFQDNELVIQVIRNGNLEIIKYLVENGADITAQDNYAIILASARGHLPLVKYLVQHGADITAQNNYAIISASAKGHLHLVKYLVRHGADITAQNNYAIISATRNGHLYVVEYLESLNQ